MSYRGRRLTDPSAIAAFSWTSAVPGATPMSRAEAPHGHDAPVSHQPPATAVDLATVEREAFATGYAQGERAGAEAAARRAEPMMRRLAQTLEEVSAVRTDMIRQTERQMVELALAVARRVLHREVSLDRDLLIAMARVALDRLGDTGLVTVRLHPDDHAATVAASAANWAGTNVTVVGDASVPKGGCRIESDFGSLDAGVDAQIRELGRALLGESAQDAGKLETRVA